MTHPNSPAYLRVCDVCGGRGLVQSFSPYRLDEPRAVTPCPACDGHGHHIVKEQP
jgi:DnaJ-class molecular chaperone